MKTANEEKTLGERIREAMEAKGLNASELAQLLALQRSTVSLILSGKRRPGRDVMTKLADVLSVTEEYLLGKIDHSAAAKLLENPTIARLLEGFTNLSALDQNRVLDLIDLLNTSSKDSMKK